MNSPHAARISAVDMTSVSPACVVVTVALSVSTTYGSVAGSAGGVSSNWMPSDDTDTE